MEGLRCAPRASSQQASDMTADTSPALGSTPVPPPHTHDWRCARLSVMTPQPVSRVRLLLPVCSRSLGGHAAAPPQPGETSLGPEAPVGGRCCRSQTRAVLCGARRAGTTALLLARALLLPGSICADPAGLVLRSCPSLAGRGSSLTSDGGCVSAMAERCRDAARH